MQGRKENKHLYCAGMNICKYKLFSKAFFILLGEMTFILIIHSYEPLLFFNRWYLELPFMVKTLEIIVVFFKLLYFKDKEFKDNTLERIAMLSHCKGALPLRTVFLPPAYC